MYARYNDDDSYTAIVKLVTSDGCDGSAGYIDLCKCEVWIADSAGQTDSSYIQMAGF